MRMGWRRAIAGAALACALIAQAPAARADQIQLYSAQYRPAEELVEVIAPLLAPDGVATADPGSGKVLLRGSPEAIAGALDVLRRLDVAPRQYRVRSELASHTELEARGASVQGWIRVGDVRVGRLPAPRGDRDRGVRASAWSRATTSDRRFASELVVMEGRQGEIWTGEFYPVEVREYDSGGRFGGREREAIALVPVRRGFAVLPRSAGEEIELEITPIVADGDPGRGIQQTAASTRVRIRPGVQLVIAGLDRDGARSSRELFGVDDLDAASDSVLLVGVELLSPAERDPRP